MNIEGSHESTFYRKVFRRNGQLIDIFEEKIPPVTTVQKLFVAIDG